MEKNVPIITAPITKNEAKQMNAVVLAFVGDAIESLYVRSVLARTSTAKSHTLHVKASHVVNATAQSKRAERILPLLTDEEMDIYRRARNSKVHSSAKNADILDYMSATGLEALYGYLYLIGDTQRLTLLLSETYNDINK